MHASARRSIVTLSSLYLLTYKSEPFISVPECTNPVSLEKISLLLFKISRFGRTHGRRGGQTLRHIHVHAHTGTGMHECGKNSQQYYSHNYIKYWPIFELLSLSISRKFAIKRRLNIPYINISHGIVATHLRYGGLFNNRLLQISLPLDCNRHGAYS